MPADIVTTTKTPGRPGLAFATYEQAYRELTDADGTPPSQRQLRKYLGTGSNTTLAGYRRRIAEERSADEKPPEPGSLDAELLSTVQRLASQIALDEAQVADDRVAEIQQKAEHRVRVAESTMEKRLQDTALLEHRAKEAESELANSRQTNNTQGRDIKVLREQLHSLNTEHQVTVQSLDTVTRENAVLSRERDTLKKTAENALESEKSLQDQSLSDITALQQQLDEIQKSHSVLKEQYFGLTSRFDDRLATIESLKTEIKAVQTRLDKAHESRDEALVKLDQLRMQQTQLSEQAGNTKTELTAERRAHQVSVERYKTQLEDKEREVVQLRDTVSALLKTEDQKR